MKGQVTFPSPLEIFQKRYTPFSATIAHCNYETACTRFQGDMRFFWF